MEEEKERHIVMEQDLGDNEKITHLRYVEMKIEHSYPVVQYVLNMRHRQ